METTSKAKATKEGKEKLDFIKIKDFYASKIVSRKWKDNPQNGRKYLHHISDKGLVPSKHKEHITQKQKDKQPKFKGGKGLE